MAKSRQYLLLAARVLLFLYIACLGYSIRYHAAATDLDGAWAVGLNYAQTHGLIHGRDFVFTYGPLSYLTLPMPMGSNFGQGIVFQLLFWAVWIGLSAWLVFVQRVPLSNLLIFAVCLFPASGLFVNFGYAGPDFFLGMIVLLLVAATAVSPRWYLFWVPAILLASLLLLVKLSTGISAISAMLAFPLALFLLDRGKAIRLLGSALLGIPLVFFAGFMVYYPSLDVLGRYLKAGFETSAGHSTAMSLPGDAEALTVALAMLAGFVVLSAALYKSKQVAFATAVACFGPLFLEFKHSFIREPGHVGILFAFAPFAFAVILLFADLRRGYKYSIPVAAVLVAGIWLVREWPRQLWFDLPGAPVARLRQFGKVLDYAALRTTIETISNASLQSRHLPDALLQRVGERTVSVIPLQCAYAAANPIRYVPLRTLQATQGYTAYLDQWTAEGFEGPGAPEFVIFEWEVIDGHHPLLDVPQTAFALFRNYEWDSTHGPLILLRKRAKPLDGTLRSLGTSDVRFGEPLKLPPSTHPLLARVAIKFNLTGRLRDFLFRVPEVRGLLSSEGTRSIIARVPPLVLSGGVPVNLLPVDLKEMESLFRESTLDDAATTFVISGEGTAAFTDPVRVELFEAPGISLQFRAAVTPDLSKLTPAGVLAESRIEALNNQGVVAISEREVVDVKTPNGYLYVNGWAVGVASVYLQLDGKLYPANYGRPRPDILMLFHKPGAETSGFDWSYPAWKLGNTVHELSLKMMTPDGLSYHDGSKKVRLRIVP